jgi:allantoinase
VVGFKAFMSASGIDDFAASDDLTLYEGLARAARLGRVVAVHAENDAITRELAARALADGRTGVRDYLASRPAVAELEAIQRAILLAHEAGCALHVVHVSTGRGVALVAEARAQGVDVSCETCPHYLALDEDDLARLGPLGKCAPPLRARRLVDELWSAVLDGSIDLVASDHSPCPPDLKAGPDIWSAWGGIGGVQTTLAVLLTEGVHRRGLGLPRLVSLVAGAPARRFGLYPRKGSLAPGADADLALVALDHQWRLEAGDLRTRWPLNPFVGRTLRGRVVTTLVRGQPVFQADRLCVEPGYGRLVAA